MANSNPSEAPAGRRRDRLRDLDALLDELEALNLRETEALPDALADRLGRAGVVFQKGAPASQIIDLVFQAQQPYLRPFPSTAPRRRPAA